MNDDIIFVKVFNESMGYLKYGKVECAAYLGRKGTTKNKVEGDKKTPLGVFELGIAFGMHERNFLKINPSIKYIKITESMYWVDDVNSKYYNQFVDCKTQIENWGHAEHLIDYKKEYEYAIEIKANPNNIPNKGSAIFMHCSNNKPTNRMHCN